MPMFSFNKKTSESGLSKIIDAAFFKTAYRNKVLASWAAGKIGIYSSDKAKYVKKIVMYYLLNPHDTKLVIRICDDFKKAGIRYSEEEVILKLHAIEERIDYRKKY